MHGPHYSGKQRGSLVCTGNSWMLSSYQWKTNSGTSTNAHASYVAMCCLLVVPCEATRGYVSTSHGDHECTGPRVPLVSVKGNIKTTPPVANPGQIHSLDTILRNWLCTSTLALKLPTKPAVWAPNPCAHCTLHKPIKLGQKFFLTREWSSTKCPLRVHIAGQLGQI
jgi:hypothetical protein